MNGKQSALSATPEKTASAKTAAEKTTSGVAERQRPSLGRRTAEAAEKSWRPFALLLVCFGAWWVIAATDMVESYLVPSPGATFDVIMGKPGCLWQHGWFKNPKPLADYWDSVQGIKQ
ncbi:hypothetical protein [Streptomyces sp. NPDC003006]